MKFIEVGGIQTFVDINESSVLEYIGERRIKSDLDAKQQYIASNLVKRGVLRRIKENDQLYYVRIQ